MCCAVMKPVGAIIKCSIESLLGLTVCHLRALKSCYIPHDCMTHLIISYTMKIIDHGLLISAVFSSMS